MAQKWTDLSSGTTTDRMVGLDNGAVHLSDGTLVWLDTDGTNLFLKYSSDHTTVNTIATVATGFAFAALSRAVSLLRDSSNNLYVVGPLSGGFYQIQVQAFTKGSGFTWTAQSAVATPSTGGQAITTCAAIWANTGGGTGGHGHILCLLNGNSGTSEYEVCDAGIALAGSGTLLVGRGFNPPGLNNNNSVQALLDVSGNGFGATSGVFVSDGTLASWSLTGVGVFSSASVATLGASAIGAKIRLVWLSSNRWAVVTNSTSSSGHYMTAAVSSSAILTASTDSGTPTNLPLNGAGTAWDAFADPVVANQVWVIATAAVSGGNQQVYRLSAACGSGVTWAGAVTTDDLLSTITATGSHVRSVVQPASTAFVDWQVFAQTAATPTYALLGDYTTFASAPNAPTGITPANGTHEDVSGTGIPETWAYNSTDGANQNAYAARIKVSGAGSYSYYNAGTGALQGTIVWNSVSTAPGANFSFTIPAASVSDGNVYNLSAASQEAISNLQGPFASDVTVTAQAAPSLTVTGPTGSVVTTNQPTATWTPTPGAGASITAYRVVVESGAYGTVPGSGTQLWDSGVLSGNPGAQQWGVAGVNSTTYRTFVQVTETGGQTSAWGHSDATISLDQPATPSVTATPGTDPTTGAPRIVVAVQGHDNLLSAAGPSFEDGTTGGWSNNGNATLVNTTAQALDGTHSLSLTAIAAGQVSAISSGGSTYPVTPNAAYTGLAFFRAAVTARSVRVDLAWFTSAGTFISEGLGVAVTDATTGWTLASFTAVAPANAAFVSLAVYVLSAAASEVHYVDCAGIFPGVPGYEPTVASDAPVAWWKLGNPTGTTEPDSSGLGNNGTINGTVTPGQPGGIATYPAALGDLFDGTTGYVAAHGANPSGAGVSVECWFKRAASQSGNPRLVNSSHSDADHDGFELYFQLGGTTPTFAVGNGTTFATAAGSAINDTAWHHVVGTYDGTTVRIYVDGTQAATAPLAGSMAAGGTGVEIGRGVYGSDFFAGSIDEVAVYATALSAARVLAHYQAATVNGWYVQGWSRGGLVGSTTAALLRSDGVYVRDATPTSPTAIPAGSQSVTVNDPEVTPGVAYTYTAVVSAVLGGATVSSPTSAPSNAAQIAPTQAWIFNPLNVGDALPAYIASFPATTRGVNTGTFSLLGNPVAAVTTDVFQARTGTLTLVTLDEATADALVNELTTEQAIFALVRPAPVGATKGTLLYFTVTGPVTEGKAAEASGVGTGVTNTNTAQRMVSVPFAEQSRPG